jgi:hypothetical protein
MKRNLEGSIIKNRGFLSIGKLGFLYVEICLAYVLRILLVGPHIGSSFINLSNGLIGYI